MTQFRDYFSARNIEFKNISQLEELYTKTSEKFEKNREIICIAINKIFGRINCDVNKSKIIEQWIECTGACYTELRQIIEEEITSTSYFIRLFINSIIYIPTYDKPKLKLQFSVSDNHTLTGIWEKDSKHIYINGLDIAGQGSHKLIIGLGPSASGKTFMATEIIKLFKAINVSFPNIFISVDGGNIRECSIIYKMVVEGVRGYAFGIKNLIETTQTTVDAVKSVGIKLGHQISKKIGVPATSGQIFNSNKIKNQFTQFLADKYTGKISLYVPETFGSSTSSYDYYKKINRFVTITGDMDSIINMATYERKGM